MIKRFAFLALIPFLFNSCAKYRAEPLTVLETQTTPSGKVSWAAKEFNAEDSKKHLGRDVLKKGYQPIQLCIVNNGDYAYTLTPDQISLPVVEAKQVADDSRFSTKTRILVYTGLGLISIPLIVFTAATGIIVMALSGSLGTAGFITGLAIAYGSPILAFSPAVVDGVKSSKANKKLKVDYEEKGVSVEKLAPHSTFNKILFVPNEHYQDHFTVTLINEKTHEEKVLEIHPSVSF